MEQVDPSPSLPSKTAYNYKEGDYRESIERINYLCLHFDPYLQPIPENHLLMLIELGLEEHLSDPFRVTRELLILQEKLILNP